MTHVHGPDFLAIQVRDLEGSGDDARVRVNFGGMHGMKLLSLQHAKLTAS